MFPREPGKKKKVSPLNFVAYKQQRSFADFLPDESDYQNMQGRNDSLVQSRFLGIYGEQAILKTFEKFGLIDEAKKIGFSDFHINILAPDANRQSLEIRSSINSDLPPLAQFIMTEAPKLTLAEHLAPDLTGHHFNTLVIQWILLQNPRAEFSASRPALPGQNFPGLGVGQKIKEMMVAFSEYNHYQMITNCPAFFHNALMYNPTFLYLDPAKEGLLRALQRDLLKNIGLAKLSWGAYLSCIKLNDETFAWGQSQTVSHSDITVQDNNIQVCPLCPELKAHFESSWYQDQVQAVMEKSHFSFDEERYSQLHPLDENGHALISITDPASPNIL